MINSLTSLEQSWWPLLSPLPMESWYPFSLTNLSPLPESLSFSISSLLFVSCLISTCWLGPIEDCCCGTIIIIIRKLRNATQHYVHINSLGANQFLSCMYTRMQWHMRKNGHITRHIFCSDWEKNTKAFNWKAFKSLLNYINLILLFISNVKCVVK